MKIHKGNKLKLEKNFRTEADSEIKADALFRVDKYTRLEMKKQDFVNDYAQFMHIHIHTYIRTVWDTHLADYLEIIRAQSPVCRSAGPVGGYSGRPSVTAGRTCNTRSTPRGTPGRTPAASPDRSS